jgi:predicted transposase/invertase (TIGR01784 family)
MGREEGREEGREVGVREARLETARRMNAKGSDIAFICEITGLSPDVIEKL